jgi:uncharacterized protein (TIGR00266 family)
VDHQIVGTTLPVLEMTLQPGESIVAQSGELSWMTSSIELHTTTNLGGCKGIFGAIGRAMGGGSLFMTQYTAKDAPGMVAFATKVPGSILPITVTPGQTYFVHRTGFLCGTEGIEVGMGFQRRLGAGIFGGEGFILQKVTGNAQAWIELDGEVVTYDLKPGETLRVIPGHVGLFEGSVQFDITMLKGIRNIVFGDGLFLATLTGPGRIWLQSLPISGLATALAPYLDKDGSLGSAAAGGIAGAALGGLFGGGNQQD